MKIPSLTMTDPWFSHVARHRSAHVETLTGVPVDISVLMDQVTIEHGPASEHFRPHLRLAGRVTGVKPSPEAIEDGVSFGYGITETTFDTGAEPILDAVYDFTDDQLVALVAKGYFNEEFRAPESMVGIEWILPAESDVAVFSPGGPQDPPLVFHGLRGLEDMRLTVHTSGYELTEVFAAFEREDLGVDLEDESFALDLDEELFEQAPEVEPLAQESTKTAEEIYAERVEALYQERIASRLSLHSPLPAGMTAPFSEVTPTAEVTIEHGLIEEELFDGYLAFELEDGVLEVGDLVFEFDAEDIELAEHGLARALGETGAVEPTATLAAPQEAARGRQRSVESRLAALRAEREASSIDESYEAVPSGASLDADLDLG